MTKCRRPRALIVVAAIAVTLMGAREGSASITEPGAGATVRGVVRITESPGGSQHYMCGGGQTAIAVYRFDGANVHFTSSGPGPYTANWDSFGQPRGQYSIYGQEWDAWVHTHYGSWGSWYSHCHYSWRVLSSSWVTLDNQSALAVSAPGVAYWNGDLRLDVRLTDPNNGGRGISGRTVRVSTDGEPGEAALGTASDGSGSASIRITQPAGTAAVRARFDDDAYWRGSNAQGTVTILARPTALQMIGQTEVYAMEQASVGARLVDSLTGAPVAGKQVELDLVDLQGSTVASAQATTDASGIAAGTFAADHDAGDYTVRARFADGAYYQSTAGAAALSVLPRPTAVTYDGAVQGFRGRTVTLSARLHDQTPESARAGEALAGKRVVFTVGSVSAEAETDADGRASASVTLDQPPAEYTVVARFAGDARYAAAEDSASFLIGWEYVFEDADRLGTVNLNVLTREFQFESPSEGSQIKADPAMQVWSVPAGGPACDPTDPAACAAPSPPCDVPDGCTPGAVEPCDGGPDPQECAPLRDPVACGPPVSTGCARVVSIAYTDDDLTLDGWFDLEAGRFSAVVRTPNATYALRNPGPV